MLSWCSILLFHIPYRTFRCSLCSTPRHLLLCWNGRPGIHLVFHFFMWPISCLYYWSPHLHRSEITSSVGCVLCVPLPIRGGCRLQTLQYPLSDGSLVEMQPNIEYGQTLRGSACPHLRALFINLEDSSKQANELLHEPHTASLWDVSKGCVRDLSDQITVVASLAPRQIDRGDVKWPYTQRQKQGSTEADPVGKEAYDSSFS